MKQRKGWRMSCDVGKARGGLENELWRRWSTESFQSLHLRHSSFWFSKLSVTSPTSQLILQPFHRFTYVTTHSPTLPSLHLRHNSFSNPSFASPTSQDFHLRYLASRPCQWLQEFPDFTSDGLTIYLSSMKQTWECIEIYMGTYFLRNLYWYWTVNEREKRLNCSTGSVFILAFFTGTKFPL